jgi:hypothetical protein
MILRLLCIWLVFYSLLASLMHGTMNLKSRGLFPRSVQFSRSSETFLCQTGLEMRAVNSVGKAANTHESYYYVIIIF